MRFYKVDQCRVAQLDELFDAVGRWELDDNEPREFTNTIFQTRPWRDQCICGNETGPHSDVCSDNTWNFVYFPTNTKIGWYKHFGRDVETTRDMSSAEFTSMIESCLDSLHDHKRPITDEENRNPVISYELRMMRELMGAVDPGVLARKVVIESVEKLEQAAHDEGLMIDPDDYITLHFSVHAVSSIPHITCPKCLRTSYNPNDIRFKFCGACDEYHDGTKRELGDHADELWKPGETP